MDRKLDSHEPEETQFIKATSIRELITINHAAERVSVSRRTIYNWIADGKVEYCRTASGSVRIYADTLWRTELSLER